MTNDDVYIHNETGDTLNFEIAWQDDAIHVTIREAEGRLDSGCGARFTKQGE